MRIKGTSKMRERSRYWHAVPISVPISVPILG